MATERVSFYIDGFNLFDKAFLITGDSDLSPPVEAVLQIQSKKVVLCFPPFRFGKELEQASSAQMRLNKKMLRAAQFPQDVVKSDGNVARRPKEWP